jgi:hypothetical protein
MNGRLTSVSEPRRQQPKRVRKSEAMARKSSGWRERGQANRTRNPELFSVREEEKGADPRSVARREGVRSKGHGDFEQTGGASVSESI